ncbi:hypothetical protein MsAg5_00800 [Methanosarcinaceae archaeon Ag5]|uniref:Uncharacterized protein n=1 Tax=Methanolapillus africanus TaxID=3028297 RepID=A0AAE4MIJ5_9EURY|nr:hypothetical protein [Methanosarcinaceae archaeon Ag5]
MIGILIVLIFIYAFLSGNLHLSLSLGPGTGGEVISMLTLILTVAVLFAVGYSFFEDYKRRNYIYQIWLFDYAFCLLAVGLVFFSFILNNIIISVTVFTFSFQIANGYFVLIVALFLGAFYLIYSFTRLSSVKILRMTPFIRNLIKQLNRADYETFVMDLDTYFDSISRTYDRLELREQLLARKNIPLWKADRNLKSQTIILFNDIFENPDLLTYIVRRNRILTMKLLRVRIPRDYPKNKLFKKITEIALDNDVNLFALPPAGAHVQSNLQNFIYEDVTESSEIIRRDHEQNPGTDFKAAMAAQRRNGFSKDMLAAYTAGTMAVLAGNENLSDKTEEYEIRCGYFLCGYHLALTTKFIHEKQDLDFTSEYFNIEKNYQEALIHYTDRLTEKLKNKKNPENKDISALLDKFFETHLAILSAYIRNGDFSKESFPRNILDLSMTHLNRMMKALTAASILPQPEGTEQTQPADRSNHLDKSDNRMIAELENYFRFYFEMLTILQKEELKDEFAGKSFETLKKTMDFSKKYDADQAAEEIVRLRKIIDNDLKKRGKTPE